MIYLDNAATTIRKPPQVVDAVVRAMSSFGNSARGTHEGALTASRTIYDARCKAAALFGCPRADHVAFTANSTEALNIAINGLIRAGDHVISTDLEHNSVLRPLYRLREERDVSLDFVPADPHGNLDYADFERLLRPNTRAIVCTHASNLTGNAVDLARVGEIAQRRGVLFVVDASRSQGANKRLAFAKSAVMAMLEKAGLSVAAGNAVEDVKKACDYTTHADNNEGVVAELIKKFIFHEDI